MCAAYSDNSKRQEIDYQAKYCFSWPISSDNHLIYRNRLGIIQKTRSKELYGISKSLRSSIQTTKLF